MTQSLAALFEKAGLKRGASLQRTIGDARLLKRELMLRAFAEALLKNQFDPIAAYRDLRLKSRHKVKKQGWAWMRQKRMLAHLRDLVQSQSEAVMSQVRLDLIQLVGVTEALISSDICDYIETATEYVPPVAGIEGAVGTYRTFHRLNVNPNALTTEQRLAISKIRMKDGYIESVETVDRLKAIQLQVGLIQALGMRGGSDTTFLHAMQTRIRDARQAAIDAQIKLSNGKVVPMQAKKA